MLHFIIQPNYLKYSNKLIGLGATSEVYQGTYKGCDVSIKKIKYKELNDTPSKAYQNEVSVLTSIKHRNIVTLIGTMVEEKENLLCIVTEYCEGGTLYDLLNKKKNIEIPWNLRLKFLIEISEAMNFLHKNEPQIIHRDLKSLNILLTHQLKEKDANNHVSIKICDFGLSQILSKENKNFNLNGLGSVQWMAPELLQNYNPDITDKVDVYSFGIIIWEMYSRTQPYKGMSVSQIINFVCNEKGRPNCDLIAKYDMTKGLFELMTKCWDKNPSSRPNFDEILQILNETCGVI
jgi:serine/threonine protein kinase